MQRSRSLLHHPSLSFSVVVVVVVVVVGAFESPCLLGGPPSKTRLPFAEESSCRGASFCDGDRADDQEATDWTNG